MLPADAYNFVSNWNYYILLQALFSEFDCPVLNLTNQLIFVYLIANVIFCFQVSGYHIGCDFSPDGKIVSSGSADGKIFFYDQFTSHVIRTLEAHSAPCMDAAYHPTLPSCVASCGWDGQVKVWT